MLPLAELGNTGPKQKKQCQNYNFSLNRKKDRINSKFQNALSFHTANSKYCRLKRNMQTDESNKGRN